VKRLILVLALVAAAGVRAEPVEAELGFDEYLALVGKSNLSLAAQRYNVPIAQAQVTVAKLFPDPQLSGGISSFDIARSGAPTALDVNISAVVERGGKRGNRIRVADRGVVGAKDDLSDFIRTLRGQAADAFVDALSARLVLSRKQKTFDSLTTLVQKNEDSRRAGNIGDLPVIQAKVEADKFKGDLLLAAGDVRKADIALAQFIGTAVPIAPKGDLKLAPRTFDEAKLVADAKARRPDVLSARAALAAAEAKIDLAHSNLAVDPTITLGYMHSFHSYGEYNVIAPTPAVDTVTASVSIPLPIARRRFKGELEGALATRGQAEQQLKVAELEVEVEIRQALVTYRTTIDRLNLYTSGILTNAEKVLQDTTYNFTRGNGTQLEVLDAQRTVDEVYLDYYQALADHAHALIAVEQAAGIWDIKL